MVLLNQLKRKMSDYLPQELMIDIFIKLPIKSILLSRSVCKSWYSLLNSPNFISTHLNQNQNMNHIIMQYHSINPEEKIYALFHDNENLDQYVYFDLPFERTSSYLNIVGSCNGILCLVDDNQSYPNHFYLWNPSIRKSVKLPTPIYTFETRSTCDHIQGFGFDYVTNDYKVVRIVDTNFRLMPYIELYKLSTGVWKDISHVALSYQFFCSTPPVYLNGASHWIASKWEELEEPTQRNTIVLFDMHDEIFLEMMLPSSLTNEVRLHFDEMFLFVLEESLCLVDNNYDQSKPTEIWMMREYGAADTWVKQFCISSHHFTQHYYDGRCDLDELVVTHKLVKPMTIRRNGEIIWKASRRLLVSVDHIVEKFKDVGLGNSTNCWCHVPHYVDYYKESLVLPDKWTNNCVGDACEESFTCQKMKRKWFQKNKRSSLPN